ncbi:MAG TPA: hypothetical protein VK101_01005 [Limnochordia bacterium]|nr:hypothetical protein [Limnochordia bacterium]
MKDERIQAVVHQSQAMGFSILYFGMLAIFLFRMVYLKQSVRDFGDFALVWLIAGLLPSVLTAMRGGLDPAQMRGRARWLAPVIAALVITGFQVYYNLTEGVGYSQAIGWISSLLTLAFSFVFALTLLTLNERLLQFLQRRWERHNLE